jgi:integrase
VPSVDKVKTGWRARYRTPDNKSRSKTFDRKVDAERFLTSVEHSKLSGAYVDPSAGRKTFGEWWAACEAATVALRPSTRARDESYGRQYLLPHFGATPLGRIDHLNVKTWIAKLSASGLAPATVVKAAQLLSRTLRSAVDAGLIPANPADRVSLPKIEREEMRFLTPAQVAALADEIDPRYRAFVLLGAYAGLRVGELGALRRSRVDLMRGRVDVAETLVEVKGHHHLGPPKTRAGRRSVPLPRSIVTGIEESIRTLGPDDFVFPAPEGGLLRASLFRTRIWHPAVERAGLTPLRCHDLRHTAVALWIAAGASPKEVAARAGHSSVVTVLDRYGHLLPGSEERVTDALDAMALAVPSWSAAAPPHLLREVSS